MKEELSKTVIQSYVYYKETSYFVSTIYRRSSATLNPDGWYYEIYGWELKEDKSRREWIIEDSAGFLETALEKHNSYCKQLLLTGKVITSTKKDY